MPPGKTAFLPSTSKLGRRGMRILSKLAAGIACVLGGFVVGMLCAYYLGYTEKEVVMSSAFGTAAILGVAGLFFEDRIRSKLPRPYQWLWLLGLMIAAIGMVVVFILSVP